MKRTLAIAGIVLAAAAGVWLIQRLNQDQQYARLLADGEVALRGAQTYVAIEAFSGALALRPTSMVAYYRRGEAYAAQGQDERAILDFQEARRLAPDAPEPLEGLGRLYDRREEPSEAADWYAQAADRLKDADPNVLYALALARYRAGAPAAAREPLRRALARNGSMPEAHYLLGLVYRDAQQPDEAVASIQQALRLSPSLLPAREELANLYKELGRAGDEAAELRTLALMDQQIDRQIAVALADMRAGQLTEAIETLRVPSLAQSNDPRVALALGRIYLARAERTGDRPSITRALASLENAIGGTVHRSERLALFGRALYLSGDVGAAERLLREAVSESPVDPEAYRFLADAAERSSHADVARDALISLDTLEGDTVSADIRAARARRIGSLAMTAGDPATTVAFLTQALKTSRADVPTLGLLARARWQMGDHDGARQALGQALALDQRDRDLQRLSRVIH